MNWAGGFPTWAGGMSWAGGFPTWAGGMSWAGGMNWAGNYSVQAGGFPTWAGGSPAVAGLSATNWVYDLESTGLSVEDIDGSSACIRDDCKWQATVTFSVQETSGAPVADATVQVQWLHSGNSDIKSCVTDQTGQCSVKKSAGKGKDSITFTVLDVSHASLGYLPALNSDPDGDSDGISMVVDKPLTIASAGISLDVPAETDSHQFIFLPLVNGQ